MKQPSVILRRSYETRRGGSVSEGKMNNEREEGETRGSELSTKVRRNKPPRLPRNSHQATFDAICSIQ